MSIEKFRYKGFTINIEQDLDSESPFTSTGWLSCYPPMYVHHSSGGTEYGLDLYLPELTREQIKANAQAIAKCCEEKSLLRLTTNCCYQSREAYRSVSTSRHCYYSNAVEMVNDAISGYFEELNTTDKLEFLVSVYRWQGIVALSTSRNGYVQSAWTELLIVATPEWLKETGAVIDKPDDLESYADLYAAWAFGDVYGFVIPETDDSCWGFYGSDHRDSGLLEHAENSIDCTIARNQENQKAFDICTLAQYGGTA